MNRLAELRLEYPADALLIILPASFPQTSERLGPILCLVQGVISDWYKWGHGTTGHGYIPTLPLQCGS